ncbi:hypothetical protein GCM10022381_34890 [Leifsonia kafniensis]|uniref:InlB B-repeat-containing protein n=1 Tax=Leifsonia kafniensis TaxID=475957 RepID=A0ABP7KY96_9MICO
MRQLTLLRPRVSAERLRRLIAVAVVVPLVSGGIVAGSAITASAADVSTTVNNAVELAAAFDAASGAGNTIVLGADITSSGLTVPVGATVTLDLNDHTLGVTGADEKAGIAVRVGSTLIIDGPGELTAQGGDAGAGIGSPKSNDKPETNAGTVIIHGGTIRATGGNLGAGIGSGGWSAGGTTTITGGEVHATGGGSAAGIGGGYNHVAGTISISGGSVTAIGGAGGAGIGNGVTGHPGTLTITGGTVDAIGTGLGAGLGGGNLGSGLNIAITGGSVSATGGSASGIAVGPGAGYTGSVFGSLSNAGSLTTAPGNIVRVFAGQTFFNSGTFVNDGLVVVDGVLDNSGIIGGTGGIPVFGALVNTGTLPASFVSNTAAFTLYRNDGVVPENSSEVYAPSLQIAKDKGLSVATPTRVGYDFNGWFTAATDGELWDSATPLTTDTTLYAQWTIQSFAVTFDAQAGSAVDAQTIDYGKLAAVPTPPTRVGCDFAGWTTDAAGTLAWDDEVAITSAQTIYAQWTIQSYTARFDSNGGSAVPSASVSYGSTITPPANPSREGYTFTGWYTSAAGGSAWNFLSTATADVTLYAHWTVQNRTVTFNPQGGTAVNPVSTNYNTAIKAPTSPTRTGYTFSGWYTKTTGGSTWNFATKVTADTTVYAHWTVQKRTVTFKSQGGSAVKAISVNYNTKITVPKAPTRTGYTFAGWYTKATGGTARSLKSAITDNVTVYAHWTALKKQVTFNTQGGSKVAAVTTNYNTVVKAPKAPTRSGYTFTGWYTKATGGSTWKFTSKVTVHTTLYAHWAKK